ncbi:MAG TPA: potassium transporter [Porticoccaceae bacterium]|nr:potassium transporter [Porticoccaceae bacterium]
MLLMIFSMTMLSPIIVSWLYEEDTAPMFVSAFAITLLVGLLFWLPSRHKTGELRTRDGFFVTVFFWLVLSVFGTLPLMFSQATNMIFIDALFESVSGLTTTGATVLSGLDELPKSILYYRQQLQWLGGIGIVVIAVAILPMLGIGGMQIYRAETPGPMKDAKLTPRIAETANVLFKIYLTLTLVCALAYWLSGMSGFDAISHSFSTVAIGGFSTHDASMGFFDNDLIMVVCAFFMIVSGLNFGLHFHVWHNRKLSSYWADPEARMYIYLLIFGILVTCLYLYFSGTYDWEDSISLGVFQLVSMMTTTGFTTTGFHSWPTFLPFFLIFLSFFGACAGSTGGGIKIGRMLIMAQQGMREVYRLIHPNALLPLKIRNQRIPDRVTDAIWAFFGVYLGVFYLMVLLLLASGLDYVTAWSATAAALNNLGPGLGAVATNYADLNTFSKGVLCWGMLLGRLEIFTLLVLFTPTFWKN